MKEITINNLTGMRYISQNTFYPSYSENGFCSEEEARIWRDRSCGIACVSMILSAKTQITPLMNLLIKEGIERRAYITDIGWSHSGLAAMLIDRGIAADVKELLGIDALIELLLLGRTIILSVAPRLIAKTVNGKLKKSGHLILAHGFVVKNRSLTHIILSDPDYEKGTENFSFRCQIDDVVSFSGLRCIVI